MVVRLSWSSSLHAYIVLTSYFEFGTVHDSLSLSQLWRTHKCIFRLKLLTLMYVYFIHIFPGSLVAAIGSHRPTMPDFDCHYFRMILCNFPQTYICYNFHCLVQRLCVLLAIKADSESLSSPSLGCRCSLNCKRSLGSSWHAEEVDGFASYGNVRCKYLKSFAEEQCLKSKEQEAFLYLWKFHPYK